MKNAHFSRSRKGFTLVEMLIATSLIVLLLLFLVAMTDSTAKTWKYASSKTEQFQEARIAFDAMTRRLSEATLNTYWDVEYPSGARTPATTPSRYIRKSELRFISGPMSALVQGSSKYPTHGVFFQAPTGFVGNSVNNGSLTNLLNTSGFFLEISSTDPNLPPLPRVRVRRSQPSRAAATSFKAHGAQGTERKLQRLSGHAARGGGR